MPTFLFLREHIEKAEFRLPSDETEGVPRFTFSAMCSLSPEHEEDGCEA